MAHDIIINQVYRPGNIGDAAIIDSMIALIHRTDSSIPVVLSTKYVQQVRSYYGNRVTAVVPPIFGIPDGGNFISRPLRAAAQWATASRPGSAVRRPFKQAKAVIDAGGGSMFSSSRPGPSLGLLQHLGTLASSSRMGAWVGIASQTIGPISKKVDERALRRTLHDIDEIHVRDAESQAYLKSTGISAKLVPDLAWTKAYANGTIGPDRPTAAEKRIGVTVMDWRWADRGGPDQDRRWAAYLLGVAQGLGTAYSEEPFSVHVYPHVSAGHDDDSKASQILIRHLQENKIPVTLERQPEGPTGAAKAYAGMDAMVCTRMHSAILALSHGVPTIAYAYQPKVKGMMESIGLGNYVIDPRDPRPDHLASCLAEQLRPSSSYRHRLSKIARDQAQLAEKAFCQMVRSAIGE